MAADPNRADASDARLRMSIPCERRYEGMARSVATRVARQARYDAGQAEAIGEAVDRVIEILTPPVAVEAAGPIADLAFQTTEHALEIEICPSPAVGGSLEAGELRRRLEERREGASALERLRQILAEVTFSRRAGKDCCRLICRRVSG